MKNIVLHKHVFKKSVSYFYLKSIKFFVIFIIDGLIGYLIFSRFEITNILIWFGVFGIYTIINFVIILAIYFLIGEAKFLKRIKYILKRG